MQKLKTCEERLASISEGCALPMSGFAVPALLHNLPVNYEQIEIRVNSIYVASFK